MTEPLPAPIAAYVAANARLNPAEMLAPFAPDAVVFDEGGRHEGHAALSAWIQVASLRYAAIFTPSAWREDQGRVVVDGETAGAFPGSPLHFTFHFRLVDGAIAELEIH